MAPHITRANTVTDGDQLGGMERAACEPSLLRQRGARRSLRGGCRQPLRTDADILGPSPHVFGERALSLALQRALCCAVIWMPIASFARLPVWGHDVAGVTVALRAGDFASLPAIEGSTDQIVVLISGDWPALAFASCVLSIRLHVMSSTLLTAGLLAVGACCLCILHGG